ncbi:uncharacterized protein LOC117332880 [Pecten maximus]|uniref:uncharacterized protein LOC117332880 n=1 Tax=Pecten maximus TaxID=6579 RepID=UPI001458F385|nr:uncharacterized protein LOC117332880 [Pecten maximus]
MATLLDSWAVNIDDTVAVLVHGYFSSRVISNVALNKLTNQSSTYLPSSLAVDGFVDPPTCMSTSGTGYQWWQVDLGIVYTITNVSIQNNIDDSDGLRNFTVELSETNTPDVSGHLLNASLCYNFTESQAPGGQIITLSCPHDTIGRYLRISKEDGALTFCEVVVEVYRNECNLADIALNKPATQSSLKYGGVAGRAVDGNLNPVYNGAPLMKDFIIEISETTAIGTNGQLKNSKLCYNYTDAHVPSAELRTLTCPIDTVGRYLRITKSSSLLILCEVIVEGKPVSCLDTTCHKMPTIRQRDDQSLTEIVMELKKLMSGTGTDLHDETEDERVEWFKQ